MNFDTKLILLYKTDILPEIRDYHDILSVEVNKASNNDDKKILTMDLGGDARFYHIQALKKK